MPFIFIGEALYGLIIPHTSPACLPSPDRNPAPAGIGALTALKQIQKLGSLEAVLESLDKTKYPIPEPFPYEIAKGLFKGDLLC